MENSVWDRIPAEWQAEVDRLIAEERNIQAIVAMREHAGAPRPELRACIDLLIDRQAALAGR
ncbi:hypothetical protein [Kitasatospora camelliae]|uniref:Uncharacterized protein n=1 Tax=Kitasatospora camelliae TaxID=3156397 RepID=A0AAU8JP15_9ACTN